MKQITESANTQELLIIAATYNCNKLVIVKVFIEDSFKFHVTKKNTCFDGITNAVSLEARKKFSGARLPTGEFKFHTKHRFETGTWTLDLGEWHKHG